MPSGDQNPLPVFACLVLFFNHWPFFSAFEGFSILGLTRRPSRDDCFIVCWLLTVSKSKLCERNCANIARITGWFALLVSQVHSCGWPCS